MSLTDRTSAKDDEADNEGSVLFSTDDEGKLWATGLGWAGSDFQTTRINSLQFTLLISAGKNSMQQKSR